MLCDAIGNEQNIRVRGDGLDGLVLRILYCKYLVSGVTRNALPHGLNHSQPSLLRVFSPQK
jgi:hypothetical protein